MTNKESYNTIWSKMFDFFRIVISFLVYSILIIGYLLILVKNQEFLNSMRTTLLSSIAVFLITLFIPSLIIVLINSYILGPLSNLLFTYFYIRIDLNTKINLRDSYKLSNVFHPFSKEMIWFPMNEFKNLPADEKINYLTYYAEKRNRDGGSTEDAQENYQNSTYDEFKSENQDGNNTKES